MASACFVAVLLGWLLNRADLSNKYQQYKLRKKQVFQLTQKNEELKNLLDQKRWEVQPVHPGYLEWQARQWGLVRAGEVIAQLPASSSPPLGERP